MKKRIIVVASILCLLVVTVITGLGTNKISAADNTNSGLYEVISSVGVFIKANTDMLSGMELTTSIPDKEVVCWVNGLPISSNELQFRYGLHTSSGLSTQDINEVKNIIIREKIIEKEVADLGITPTTDEVNQFIAKEKEQAKNDPEYKYIVEKLIDTSGITEEVYWNVYERNNVFRLLVADKLSRHLMPEIYNKEVITPDDEKTVTEKWNVFMNEKLSKAEIKENPLFQQ